jgi:hypothetical protein
MAAGLTLSSLSQPLLALAQGPEPVGSEFRVNNYTTGDQRLPVIAMDAEGNFVIAWHDGSFFEPGQDGSTLGVYAQRYSADGSPLDSEFLVNTHTTDEQLIPSLAMDSSGNFVIAWKSNGQDGSGYGVYAQRYNATGTSQGSEFQVNTYTTNSQWDPAVGMDADGNFVISWTSHGQDCSSYGIYAQQYNANGTAMGSEFQVNTYTTENQWESSIAMDNDGDFVIVWASYEQDGSDHGVYAQRYNATGTPQGSEFRVNTSTIGSQIDSSVAMNDEGDFVIVWASAESYIKGMGQRYDKNGIPLGNEFEIAAHDTHNKSFPKVAMDADGDFVVTWFSYGRDGSREGIYAQRYNANGIPDGSDFRVNRVIAE